MRLGFALYPCWQLSVDTLLLTSDFRVADRNLQPAWLFLCQWLVFPVWETVKLYHYPWNDDILQESVLCILFFFFFWCSFLGTQIILSVWRLKYFFSFVKIFFTYWLSSLDCFLSFSNACFCVHYNFCIYVWSPYICSVVSVLAFLLLREIFLHLFFSGLSLLLISGHTLFRHSCCAL